LVRLGERFATQPVGRTAVNQVASLTWWSIAALAALVIIALVLVS
jgi:hypothetical protein